MYHTIHQKLESTIGSVIKGQGDLVNKILCCLAAGGHLLLEDFPGTGKTTLAAAIAERLGTKWAPEYGRELTEQTDNQLVYEDLLHIGEVQIAREEELAGQSHEWLICDTSPLTTAFYSEAMFGKVDPKLWELAKRSYYLVFLCDSDFEFVQDGMREDSVFREKQQVWYRSQLKARGIDYTVLSGSLENRIEMMLAKMQT